jgi:hypothetical protein
VLQGLYYIGSTIDSKRELKNIKRGRQIYNKELAAKLVYFESSIE